MPSHMTAPCLDIERAFWANGVDVVAGIDEVGRGSWAGPVVAAAVVLPAGAEISPDLLDVRDSKRVSPRDRDRLLGYIVRSSLAVGLGWSSHHVIDRLGVAQANRLAMMRAVANLALPPHVLLIDAVRIPDLPLPQVCMPRGETWSLSIAAASIVAKVVRDRWMTRSASRFPAYGFERNKGYGTRQHREALLRHGACPLHRRTFRPITEL